MKRNLIFLVLHEEGAKQQNHFLLAILVIWQGKLILYLKTENARIASIKIQEASAEMFSVRIQYQKNLILTYQIHKAVSKKSHKLNYEFALSNLVLD